MTTTNNQEPQGGEKCVCGNPTSCNIVHRTEGPCYVDEASEQFATYFAKNYPANTIISDPAWHAPRIFRAAKHVLASQPQAGAAGTSESIDTPEFRKLLAAVQGWHDGEPVMEGDAQDLIAHINAQLARQRQSSAPQAQGEPVAFSIVTEAVRRAIQTCKEVTGMSSRIDEYVNVNAIAHKALGTEIAGTAAQADEVRDAALLRQVVNLRMQLHFEGRKDSEDEAVWADDVMLWCGGNRMQATHEAVRQAALKRTTAADNQKGGAA